MALDIHRELKAQVRKSESNANNVPIIRTEKYHPNERAEIGPFIPWFLVFVLWHIFYSIALLEILRCAVAVH